MAAAGVPAAGALDDDGRPSGDADACSRSSTWRWWLRRWRESEGGFSSLAGVRALFDNPWALLAGWTHYLAFDLFIGGWEVRDAQQRGLPHLFVVPALVLTFLLGPAGLLFYLAIRWIQQGRKRNGLVDERLSRSSARRSQ